MKNLKNEQRTQIKIKENRNGGKDFVDVCVYK